MTAPTSYVRMTIELEVSVCGPWGHDATIGFVLRDAERQAQGVLGRLVEAEPSVRLNKKPVFHIVHVTPGAKS